MIANFDDMFAGVCPPAAARYFRSTMSDLLFKFEGLDGFVRLPGSREWFPSRVTLASMTVATEAITAEEGEP